MEKVELLDIECSSSTHKVNTNTSYHAKSSHKSQLHKSSSHHDVNTLGSGRQNQVCNVLLFGVPIVALLMDAKERLCLAQISSTLLKDFSYNEIHNRRVALGINCVQCTPVQLEILRRAGAMPVTSRRCGMITKREAERLCKSFLGSHAPPQLPDHFAFDVYHECAWGSRGSFIPSRYNSSRAKCIRCSYCQLFFSPNKFIFHSHRLANSRYIQPDAANFNSWRRHLKLFLGSNASVSSSSGMVDTTTTNMTNSVPSLVADDTMISTSNDVVGSCSNQSENEMATSSTTSTPEIVHAWEDVKAMFNGGTRKRLLSVHSTPSKHQNQQEKSSGLNNRKGVSGSVKQQQRSSGDSNGSNNGNGSGHQQSRQSQFLASSSSPFTFQTNNQHPLSTSLISPSHLQLPPSHNHGSNIWNPGINPTSSDESRHLRSSMANNAFNDILMNAAAAAAAAASSSSTSSSATMPQLPIHHPAATVLSNSFPWFPRMVVPPLFPFSHPLAPGYKYFSDPSPPNLNSSAFKPIRPGSPPTKALGSDNQHQQASQLAFPILPMQNLSPATTSPAISQEYHPFISTSTSPWLSSNTSPTKASNGNSERMVEGLGLPEDLSLNSIASSSGCSNSSTSSISSRSFRSCPSADCKSISQVETHEERGTKRKEDEINLTSRNKNGVDSQVDGSLYRTAAEDIDQNHEDESEIDITDNEDDDGESRNCPDKCKLNSWDSASKLLTLQREQHEILNFHQNHHSQSQSLHLQQELHQHLYFKREGVTDNESCSSTRKKSKLS